MTLLRLLVFSALSLMNTELALIAHSAVITSGKKAFQPSVWYPLGNFNVTLEDVNAANVLKGSGSQLEFSDVSKISVSSKHEPADIHRVTVVNETPNDHTHRSQTQTEELSSNPLLRVKLLKGSIRDEIKKLFSGPQLIVRRSVNVSSDAGENVFGIVPNTTSNSNDTGDAAHSQDLQRDAEAHTGCAVAYFASVRGNCALALEYRGSPPVWFMEKILPDDLTAVGDELLRSFGEDQACGCPAPDLSSTCPDDLHKALAIVTAACTTAVNGGGAA